MKKMSRSLKELLLYGGLQKEEFKKIESEINESNRKTIVILSLACALVFGLRLCLGYSEVPATNKVVFVTAVILFIVLATVNSVIRDRSWIIHSSAYLFMIFYLGVGILSAIGPGSVRERTTLYLVFISVSPLLYALSAAELASVVIPAEIIYLILIGKFQSSYAVYATNKGNSVFFAISGLLLGVYISNMKISGIYNTYKSARLDEIRQLNEELAANRKELEIALTEAEHANRAKTVFLNSMSHDIRTPMNAIIGFTSLAQLHIENREQVTDYLEKIMTSSEHLLSLINDVLDMSRIESGKVTIEEKTLYIPQMLKDIQTIIQPCVNEKHQHFSMETENLTDPFVEGDSLRLHQILLNILGNAVKFTPEGGEIKLLLCQKTKASKGYVTYEFRIRDNGIGMGKEFQKHIFEAFSREETVTVSGIQGTGLGMSITKNLVDMMGGNISVESEEGKGTEFTLEFRFAINADAAEQGVNVSGPDAVSAASEADFAGKRILLVEDNKLNEEIAEAILEDNGFLVEAASDGQQAVSMVKKSSEHYYDLILMDIQMPIMNGYEAARKIRAMKDPVRADIPIVAMTANAFDEDKKAAMEAGMNGHLAKPFEVSKLLELLGQLLTERSVSA